MCRSSHNRTEIIFLELSSEGLFIQLKNKFCCWITFICPTNQQCYISKSFYPNRRQNMDHKMNLQQNTICSVEIVYPSPQNFTNLVAMVEKLDPPPTWHVTLDMWHVTCDTWYVTCDNTWGVNIPLTFKLPSSYILVWTVSWRHFHKGWVY